MKIRGRIVSFLLLLILFAGTIGTTVNPILKDVKLGLDLQGGFEVLYEVKKLTDDAPEITEDMVTDTAGALSKRIDVIGVSEPNIQVESNNRIRVQLAGVEDQDSAREILSTQANLTFRDSDDNLILDGSDLKEGKAKGDFNGETNAPVVTLEMKDPNKFGEVTAAIARKPAPDNVLVIWLDFEEGVDSYKEEVMKEDPAFVSAPRVTQKINSSNVEISGNFTVQETKDLAGILNAGALPVELEEIYSTSVGAQFGEQALNKTIFAGIVGIALIFVFMLVYYRLPGFVAVVTLSVYVYLILLVFTKINAVLTLPGIAALMLGVGMAVDANILTYERIREELRVGKSVKTAFDAGAKSSFTAILDANITTLLAAVVLFSFGTSSVKGFALMLIISILVSFITAVWGSRLLLGLLVNSGILNGKTGLFGIAKKHVHPAYEEVDTLDLTTKFDRFDFVNTRKRYFTLSIVLLITGAIVLGIFKLNLGIDFASGTRVEILTEEALSADEIEEFTESIGYPTSDIVISGDAKNIGVLRYIDEFSQNEISELQTSIAEQYGAEPNISTVSSTVGQELVKNAIKALAFAALGIIIYVAFRFEWRMGLASIIGLLHDAFSWLRSLVFSV